MKTQLQKSKFIVSLLILIISTVSFSQQGISYQGVARTVEGDLMASTDVTLEININKTTEDGETIYSETHNITTDINGVFSLVISQGTPILNNFEDINWAEDVHYLNVKLDDTDLGATKFEGVPYAQAIGKFQAHKNGLTTKGTGGSIYIGDNAGQLDDFTNNHNIGFGENAMKENISGYNNLALGNGALENNNIGRDNIALGSRTLHNNISGEFNFASVKDALFSNTTGYGNTAIGLNALYYNTTGISNFASGIGALYHNTEGRYNIAIGNLTLSSNTIGDENIGFGQSVLNRNISGSGNIAQGKYSMNDNTSGSQNVGIGTRSLQSNLTGNDNIAFGESALFSNVTGNENIAIGNHAGENSLGDRNVYLGHRAGQNEIGSNKLCISNNYLNGVQTPLIYGEFDNEILGFNAKVGIGTNSPTTSLHVAEGTDLTLAYGTGFMVLGNELQSNLVMDSNELQARNGGLASDLYLQNEGGNVRVGGAIVHASDKRLKRNIDNISYGLNDILKLRPTEYFWKGKKQEYKSLGLIAQEVDEVIKNVVTYDREEDKYGVSYTELIPVLIKAIQEQEAMINSLKKDVVELKSATNSKL